MEQEPNSPRAATEPQGGLNAAKKWFLDAFEPGRGRLPIGLLTVSSALTVAGVAIFSAGVLGRPSTDTDRSFVTSLSPDSQSTLVAFPLKALESRPGTGKLAITAGPDQQITAAIARSADFAEWKKAVDVQEVTGFQDDVSQFAANKTTATATANLGDLRNADIWLNTKFSTASMDTNAADLNPLKDSGPLTVVVFAGENQAVKNVTMSWANPQASKKSNGQLWGGGIVTLLGLALLGYIAWDRHQSTVPALQREQRRGSRTTPPPSATDGTILPGTETSATDNARHLHGGQIPGSTVSLTNAATSSPAAATEKAAVSKDAANPGGQAVSAAGNAALHEAQNQHAKQQPTTPHAVPAPGQSPVTVTPAEPQAEPQPFTQSHAGAHTAAGGQPPAGTTTPADWLESNTVHHIPDEVRQAQQLAQQQQAEQHRQEQPQPGQPGQGQPQLGQPRPGQPAPQNQPQPSPVSPPAHQSPYFGDQNQPPRRDPGPRPQPTTRSERRTANLTPDSAPPQDAFEMQRISPQELLDGKTGAVPQVDPANEPPIDQEQELPPPTRTRRDRNR